MKGLTKYIVGWLTVLTGVAISIATGDYNWGIFAILVAVHTEATAVIHFCQK